MIDTNVHLSRWPFRRLRGDETPELVAMLRRRGVTQAWAGSYDALLHKDIGGVNARLADECRHHAGGFLRPFGSVNLSLPDWEEELRRCHETHRMPGIRLYPNYHGYALDDPAFARLLKGAAERRLLVQVALKMEDERTQHPLVRVPAVNPAPLAKLAADTPGLRLMVLNGPRTPGVTVEIAMLEGVAGVARLVADAGAERVCFGSNAPYFVFESALLKLKESALEDGPARAVLHENAERLLSP